MGAEARYSVSKADPVQQILLRSQADVTQIEHAGQVWPAQHRLNFVSKEKAFRFSSVQQIIRLHKERESTDHLA